MYITFGHMLEVGIHRLEEAKIADAKRDAETLLLYLEKADRTFLYVHRNDATDEYRADAYFGLIDRRAAGEPLQYILGSQEFMGLNFAVNPSVLIPRQDTETLVELALKRAGEKKRSLSILDMCCGSGAIAVSMAHFLPKAKITACDISLEALEVARGNAARNGLNGRIEFRESDLFFMTKRKKTVRIKDSFDMILSNPPYIPTQDIDTLQTEVRDHEPIKALDGGSDGLDFYRRIAEDAFGSLKKDGLMFLEIGCDQAEAVTSLLSGAGYYSEIEVHKDLTGLDRVISCRRQR
ncbi:MAG: peptide chain release factor N(5)-glutamine methyltransferase [Anaerovoracaceae bacterium]